MTQHKVWLHKCIGGMTTSLPLSEGLCPCCGLASSSAQQQTRYTALQDVLDRAYDQASSGKGAERHGQDLPFEEQPMQTISRLLNTDKGMLYQAVKKVQESARMDKSPAVRELLGAINYIAGAIIYLESEHG